MADRQTDRNDTFLREVDEELRREQLQKLWNQYGIYAIGVAALIVLGVGGSQWWKARQTAAREAAGGRFELAQTLTADGKVDDARAVYTVLAKGSTAGYQTLALFQLAAADARAGKLDAAVAGYEAIAKDPGTDPILRDLATLHAAKLRLDTADWTEMENRLSPVLAETSPWRGMARETLGLAAYKAGKTDEARKAFEALLGDKAAPSSAGERAMLMLSLLTDAEASKGETTKGAATPAQEPAKGQAAPATKAPAEKKK